MEKVIKNLCKKGGITGRRTNHSCRASTATRMYGQVCDEQLICEKTGHRSVAVRSYKKTSNHQLKEVTDILYGNAKETSINEKSVESKPPKVTKIEPTCTVSKCPDKSKGDGNEQETLEKKDICSENVQIAKGVTLKININVSK